MHRHHVNLLLLSLIYACANTPRVAPCSGELIFDSNQNGRAALYNIASDNNVALLTEHVGADDYSRVPDWSPDGSRIVFQGRRGDTSGLFLIPCSGGTATFLPNTSQGGAPAWSPDRSRIAFVRDAQILVVDLSSGAVNHVAGIPDSSFYPAWAPDGSTLAFVSRGTSAWEIFTLDLSRRVLRQLTHAPAVGVSSQGPAWSPDGKRIAFDRNRGDEFDIYVMNADGTDVQPLTGGSAVNARPVWSRDGSSIAFHSNRDRPANARMSDLRFFEIYTINADGTGLRRRTNNETFDGHPDWR